MPVAKPEWMKLGTKVQPTHYQEPLFDGGATQPGLTAHPTDDDEDASARGGPDHGERHHRGAVSAEASKKLP